MKKHITLFICCTVMLIVSASAQQKSPEAQAEADSLKAILPQLQGGKKLNAINRLSALANHSNEEKYYTYMCLEESHLQKDYEMEMFAWSELVAIYYGQFETDSFYYIAQKAIDFLYEHEFYDNVFFTRWQITRRLRAEGKTLTSLRVAEEAYAEAKALNQPKSMAYMLTAIAGFYSATDQYDEAIRYHTEAIEMARLKYEPATHFFLNNYDILAYIAYEINRPDEILRYADSLKVAKERLVAYNPNTNFQRDYFFEHCHRASAYAMLKQTEEALRQIRLAESFFNEQWKERNPYYSVRLDRIYAEYFIAVGEYDRARERLNRIIKYYDNLNQNVPFDVTELCAQIFLKKGEYKSAVEVYRDILHRKDSLNREKFYKQINELRTIYELDKSERQSEQRLAAIRHQRTVIAMLAVACTAMLIIVALVVWNRRRLVRKNRALYRQIKEQDRLVRENERFNELLSESETAATQTAKTQAAEMQAGDAETSASVIEIQYRKYVAKLNRYLLSDKNFAKPDTDIDKLLAELNISRSYLFAAVKNVTGKTVLEYIDALRLNEAKQLLEDTGDLIETIAQMCGYATVRTFYRKFREQYNITPAQYRKMAKNN
jgi:AraC-like DNA-binding protein